MDHVSFNVVQGEVFGFLGPNGAGKTTTILMLLGLTEPTSGKVQVLGVDPTRDSIKVKGMVGYMPENMGFYGDLDAVQSLRFVAELNHLPRDVADARIEAALRTVGLQDEAKKKVAAYSRGMRQRLGIAELVVKEPKLAFLDEPTLGLDPDATNRMIDLIESLAREKGMTDRFMFPLSAHGAEALPSCRHHDQRQDGGSRLDGSAGSGETGPWRRGVHARRALHEVLSGDINVQGWKPIFKKELADHFSSYRFIILFSLITMVSLIIAYMVGVTIKQDLEGVAKPKFVFLMLFISRGVVFSLVQFVAFFGPLIGLVLGFDAINRERNEGTLSKLLSQPIYRDAVINGKFLAGVVTISIIMASILLLITGMGLKIVGVIPGLEELWRIFLYLIVSIVYISFWLGVSILFSIIFRSIATSALAALALWIFFSFFVSMGATVVANAAVPDANQSNPEAVGAQCQDSAGHLPHLSHGALHGRNSHGYRSDEKDHKLHHPGGPDGEDFPGALLRTSSLESEHSYRTAVYPVAHRDHSRLLCDIVYGLYAAGDPLAVKPAAFRVYLRWPSACTTSTYPRYASVLQASAASVSIKIPPASKAHTLSRPARIAQIRLRQAPRCRPEHPAEGWVVHLECKSL